MTGSLSMKHGAAHILAVLIVMLGGNSNAMSWPGNGSPLKYVSSGELDLNNDGESEVARVDSSMHLSCHFGNVLKETAAGKKGRNEGRVYKTPGTYIQPAQPESSAVAYFWNGRGFTEVWTAD
jgi:hypothetical protein